MTTKARALLSSSRGASKMRIRDLEIPRCGIAHLRSGPSDHPGMTSVLLLAERRPEGMPGIDPDDPEFAREELQLLQRKRQIPVLGMAIDVGIELRGEEIAVDHVAFKLGHVDAVGGKAAHRLLERSGWV